MCLSNTYWSNFKECLKVAEATLVNSEAEAWWMNLFLNLLTELHPTIPDMWLYFILSLEFWPNTLKTEFFEYILKCSHEICIAINWNWCLHLLANPMNNTSIAAFLQKHGFCAFSQKERRLHKCYYKISR